MTKSKDIVIVGGGFFGLYLAEYCAKSGHKVKLFEKEPEFMARASFVNQARVHNGYHYPRSMLTALRSRVSFPKFNEEFRDAVCSDFEKFYLVGSALSKVSAKQFQNFCSRIGAPCHPADHKLSHLVNPNLIEATFATVEYAFDAIKLRDIMLERLKGTNAELYSSTHVESVLQDSTGNGLFVKVKDLKDNLIDEYHADHVFNCTYSRINYLLAQNGLSLTELKHEMTEMCLVEVPDELKNSGITLMCGPFFSVMPFPSTGFHSFSHVRYTPHYEWQDKNGEKYIDAHLKYVKDERHSAWEYMKKDAARYIPILRDCEYKRSIWEVKTILPRSDADDSRPILFLPNHSFKGFHSVMGGKIDNVYDVIEAIESHQILR